MKCDDVKKLIQETFDKNIINDKDVILHIKSCPVCSAEYKAITEVKNALRFNETVKIPGDFNAGVWKKIGQPKQSVFEKVFGVRPNITFVFKAAVVMAAVVFMVVVAKNSFVKNEMTAAVNLPQKVKTTSVELAKNIKKAPHEILNVKKQTELPEIAAIIDKVPEKKAVVGENTIKENEGVVSPGKGPVTASHKITIDLNKKEQPQTIKNLQPDSGMSVAAISKNPGETLKKDEFLNNPLEIRNNVFNPAQGGKMTLKYQIKTETQAVVQVYNKKGELIKTIFKGIRQPGIYEETWNGTCDSGLQAPAEIYIVYIKTDLLEKKIKAALVK